MAEATKTMTTVRASWMWVTRNRAGARLVSTRAPRRCAWRQPMKVSIGQISSATIARKSAIFR